MRSIQSSVDCFTDVPSNPVVKRSRDRAVSFASKSIWFLIALAWWTSCVGRVASAAPTRFGLIGDSMTDIYNPAEHGGAPSFDRSWVQILEDLRGDYVTFNNQAVDGFQTFDAINAGKHLIIRDSVNAGEVDAVGIALGVNNIAFGQLVPLFTLSTTPDAVSTSILSDIRTIADTVNSGSVKVPVFLATVPDIFQTQFVRNLVTDLRTSVQGGEPSPFFQIILQLAPANFRALLESELGSEAVEAGLENLQNAILATNLGIQQLAAEKGYGYVDLYGLLNQYQSADLLLGETLVPRDLLSSQHDFWHASSIMQALAANVAIEATASLGVDVPPPLSDQEILSYWNDRASVILPVTGENTFAIDPQSMKALTTNPLAVPEASSLAMLVIGSSTLAAFGRLRGRRGRTTVRPK